MGLGDTNAPVTRYNGMRTSESILGTTIPIIIGQQRVSWKLLWYGAFTSTQAQQQGGSGLGKGGVQYVYSASVIGSVCLGNCSNFLAVWDSIGRFAMTSYSETVTLPSSGSIQYIPANQTTFKQDLGVALPTAYTVTADDYGSPGTKTLTGTHNVPLVYTDSATPAAGQYTIDLLPVNPGGGGGVGGGGGGGTTSFPISAVANASGGSTVYTGAFPTVVNQLVGSTLSITGDKVNPSNNGTFPCTASTPTTITVTNPNGIAIATVMQAAIVGGVPIYVFNAGQAGAEVIVNYVGYRYQIQEDELNTVPINPYTVIVQYESEYQYDLGVKYYPSGIALTSTAAGSPTGSFPNGQYNPNGGHYIFSSGDVGEAVVISYAYNDPNRDVNAPNVINLTFYSGTLGQVPWSYIASGFPSAAIGYSEVAYVASSGLYLGFSPVLPQYNFEILGPYSFGNGIPDANPADAIYGLLTNPTYKLNFPVANIGTSLLGNYTITGTVTSGTFTSGEVVEQSTTGALAISVGAITVLTFTQVTVIGLQVTYTYSSFTGSAPAIGDIITVIGFVNAQNNITIEIDAVTGGSSGTIQCGFGGQVNETHSGSGHDPLVVGQIIGPTDGTHTWTGLTSGAVFTPSSGPFSSCVKAMWSANSFFISDILDSQTSLMSIISKWCEAGQSYISFDEGILKFIPLVDTTCVGNGAVYNPPTQPIIDLDYNDFVVEKNKDPVSIEQTPWQNRWNRVGIRWDVRSNDYNEDIYQVQDEASVQQYGLMAETAQDYTFITTLNAAQFAGNMRLQRFSAIYTKYKFVLKANLAFLSPGDIVTITDGLLTGILTGAGLMFNRTPVRITKMTDDPVRGISIEAETFPWSVGASLLFNAQALLPSNTNDGAQQNPGDTVPIIFEVPNRAQQYDGGMIYIFANGANSNWGGFQLWVSFNGVDYNYYDQYDKPGRIGTLTQSVTSAVMTLSQIGVSGAVVTFTYSSFTGIIPVIGATLDVSGFTNSGNNVPVQIVTISGGSSGTFTGVTSTQVNETHAGTAIGGFPTDTNGQNDLDNTNTLEVNMSQSGAVLQSVTAADRDAYVTLSAIVSPGQAFTETKVAATGTIIGTSTGGGVTAGSAGPNNPTVVSQINLSGAGGSPWSNLAGVEGNTSNATSPLTNPGASGSYALFATKFNLNVPTGAGQIIGLQAKLTASYSGSPGFGSGSVVLTTGGSQLGSITNPWNGAGPPLTPTVFTIGTITDLTAWHLPIGTLTPAVVNDPSFGFYFFGSLNVTGSSTLSVKNFTLDIAWAAGGAATTWTNPQNVSSAVSYASSVLTSSTITQYLVATNYKFNLPFGFVLDGVGVTVNAFCNTGTANLTASLYADSLTVGAPKVLTVTSTPTDYTFGNATDLWAAQNFEDLDTLNSSDFGVAFQFAGASQTVNINNVRITLYGTSTSNLELISYENVTLSGLNTYALTSIRRGVYGSYPCDHPVGSIFARMDQASITYTIDPTFNGSTIFFKFLSFNAYGNQLQQLSSVIAYDLPVGGLAPGAIDADTGALTTGIGTIVDSTSPTGKSVQWSVPQLAAVTSAAHGSFGIQNIPAGYGWVVPATSGTGIPQWVPVIAGGGGSGGVANLFVVNAAGNFSAAIWDDILCNTGAGSFNVTFPTALLSANTAIAVQKNSTDTNIVTILPTGGDTIQGKSSLTLSYFGDAVYLVSDGTSNWVILSGWIQPSNDVYIYVPVVAGTYLVSQEIYYSIPTRSFTLPISLTGSHGGCRVAPTGSVTFTILKNGSSIGTVNIAGSATTATFTFASAVTINGTTDSFSIVAPNPADATVSGFWVDFLATRSL